MSARDRYGMTLGFYFFNAVRVGNCWLAVFTFGEGGELVNVTSRRVVV